MEKMYPTCSPFGHPFTTSELSLFENKSITGRWKSKKEIKMFIQMISKTRDADCLKKIGFPGDMMITGKPTISELVILNPMLLSSVNDMYKWSWPDRCNPPIHVLNQYFQKHYGYPIASLDDTESFENNCRSSDKVSVTTDIPLISAVFSYLRDHGSKGLEVDVPTVFSLAFPEIMNTIKNHRHDKEAHKAIWALSMIYDTSILYQAVLFIYPECEEHYSYLRWTTIDKQAFEQGEEGGRLNLSDKYQAIADKRLRYTPEMNFFKLFPQSIPCILFNTSLNSFQKTSLKTMLQSVMGTFTEWHASESISEYTEVVNESLTLSKRLMLIILDCYPDLLLNDLMTAKEICNTAATAMENLSRKLKLEHKQLELSSLEHTIESCQSLVGEAKKVNVDGYAAQVASMLITTGERIQAANTELFELANQCTVISDEYDSGIATYQQLSADPLENQEKLASSLKILQDLKSKAEYRSKEADELVTLFSTATSSYITQMRNICVFANNFSTQDIADGIISPDSFKQPNTENSGLGETIHQLYDNVRSLTETREENALLHEELEMKTQECESIKAELKLLKGMIHDTDNGNENAVFAETDYDPLPDLLAARQITLPDILTVIENKYPDNVVFLPEAKKSAEIAAEFRNIGKVYDYLTKLITAYLPMINGGRPDSEARNVFPPKAYSANESETVSGNSRLMSYRTFEYKGSKLVTPQHLIVGVARGVINSLRIHFAIVEGRVVITHCGEHLPLN